MTILQTRLEFSRRQVAAVVIELDEDFQLDEVYNKPDAVWQRKFRIRNAQEDVLVIPP